MTPLVGIVLAAGQGARMGGPKAMLRLGGVTLAEQHARRLLEAGCARVIVVVPRSAEVELRLALAPFADAATVELVVATTASPAETLAVALASRDLDGALLVITPVDLLPVAPATVQTLVATVRESGGTLDAATPTFQGRGGHPIVARRSALREEEAPALPLRDRLRNLGPRRARVAVDDAAILGDFDVPGDLPAAP